MSIEDQLRTELALLEQHQARRATRSLLGIDRAHPRENGRGLVAFCSNDYLGLAGHPALPTAAAEAARAFGYGSGAARLICGGTPQTDALESELAAYVHQEAALLFPTGYQTNIGVLTALAGPGDLIASDAANHASIVDGCRLTRAKVAVYRHADADDRVTDLRAFAEGLVDSRGVALVEVEADRGRLDRVGEEVRLAP
jgi:7-keto-8-aminopelargonate synthetase-like enzyme